MTDTETIENTETTTTEEAAPKRFKKTKTITDLNGRIYDGDETVRWKFDPDDVIIVGADDLGEENDPLLDPGATSKLDDGFVKSIGRDGIKTAVLVTPREIDGILRPCVVAGRHRVRAIRRAKSQKLLSSKDKYYVPADSINGTPEDLRSAKHSENFVRVNRDIMQRAKAAEDLHGAGRKNADIALDLNVSVSTVENLLALARATKPVVDAMVKGQLPPTAAYKLAKLEPEKQAAAVKDTLAEATKATKGDKPAKAKVSHATTAKNRSKGKEAPENAPPSRSKINKILVACRADDGAKIVKALSACEPIDFLRWLAGEVTERVLPAEIREIVRGNKE